jgi:UDP-N-acetylglucosamine 1-carboxyvinyltransferase
MATYVVRGGRPLHGRVRVSGSKNAALPLLLATVAAGSPCILRDIPDLSDIDAALKILKHLGVGVERLDGGYRLDPSRPTTSAIPHELANSLRMSIILLGPLLARFGEASTASPGGCEIGTRPIDFHLAGLRAMGARIEEAGDRILCRADRLRGAEIALPVPSVGATEHMLIAGSLAEGDTVIRNAAREPEVVQVADYLGLMGAPIAGAGTTTVHVHGVAGLGGAELTLIPDRIEAGTYLLAAAAAGGDVLVEGARAGHLGALLEALRRGGCRVNSGPAGVRLIAEGRPQPVDLMTGPFPEFPTDLQSPALAWLTRATGTCRVTDLVFPERFGVVAELRRLGACVALEPGSAVVAGVPSLHGAALRGAADLRGAAALVIAALAADGESAIADADALARGYHDFAENLRSLGADVRSGVPGDS